MKKLLIAVFAVFRFAPTWPAGYALAGVTLALMLLLFPALAFAQADQAVPPLDFSQLAAQVVDAIAHKQWWILASVIVSLLTWALRANVFAKLPGKAGTFLVDHPVVGYVTPFVLSAIGGVVTTFASGMPFSWPALIGEILKVGAGAVAAFIGAKKVLEATRAGAEAAAGITDKQAAIDKLRADLHA